MYGHTQIDQTGSAGTSFPTIASTLAPHARTWDRDIPVQNIPGNYYDKYGTSNPIARSLMNGFLGAFDALVAKTGARRAYEVGCGEGHLSCRLLKGGISMRGSDLESVAVEEANLNTARLGFGRPFAVRSLYELSPSEASADLVICCEVLEHLPDPNAALQVLSRLAKPFLLVSVPREPIWRLLNLARGAYLSCLGNTPGHIQHWTSGSFTKLLQQHFEVVDLRHPLPWTMALCRSR